VLVALREPEPPRSWRAWLATVARNLARERRRRDDRRHRREQESPPPSKTPGPTKEFGDPIALAGTAGEIADSNANVRLFLYTEVVRKHHLGERISGLLKKTPQWKDFFGPSKIDPISDIDRVMIAGPQLRSSAQVVAIVQHRLSQTRIEQAFDALVQRDGAWIDRKPLIARGKAWAVRLSGSNARSSSERKRAPASTSASASVDLPACESPGSRTPAPPTSTTAACT